MSALLDLPAVVPARAWLAAAGLIAALLCGLTLIHDAYKRGEESATTTIERANNADEGKADAAGEAVERCYAGGGHWDRFERVCVGARQ